MDGISAAATSAGKEAFHQALPPCVGRRAEELLDIAILKLLALCLGGSVALQILALSIALLSPPVLHYIPEVGR